MSTTLTVKGQVTIPKNIRDYLRLAPGDRIDFAFSDDGSVRLSPVRKAAARPKSSKFTALVGSRRKDGRTAEVMEMLRGYAGDQDDPGFR
jgi:antitoxin PrlF